ncbi:MAG: toll/interleukin-1 receptor domain-containing protein [Anaerolineae bacterium]|nr:toll/interleukin-1 receptor domain-containing protein [Anaerolineae bacterium]
MKTAFISYSRKDKSIAIQLSQDLEIRGLSCWIDLNDIPGGKEWAKTIDTALANCRYLMLLLSPHSVSSEAVRYEYLYAIRNRKIILPLYIEECNLPDEIAHIQYIDFRDYAVGFSRLLNTLPQDVFNEEMSLDALISKLQSDEVERRRDALLSISHAKIHEAIEHVITALGDRDEEIRATAAWVLDQLNNPKAIPQLLVAIGDLCFDVRSNAGWALVHLGIEAIRPVREILMNSDNAEAHEMAYLILDHIDHPDATTALNEYNKTKRS